MGIPKRQLFVYALAHFWVDFSCALLLLTCLWGQPTWPLCVIVYNFCAFALQMPLGLLADGWDRNARVAALGCALVALGWALTGLPLLAAMVAGVGNGCFHVGGGLDVLNAGTQKSAALGVFVSPGALGLYLGTLLGKSGAVGGGPAMAGLACLGVAILLIAPRRSGNAPVAFRLHQNARWALACCFLVVVLRSYVGMVMAFPWKTGVWAVAALCAAAFGKAAGGFLGDAVGMQKAAAWSLGASALLFCVSGNPLAGVLAIFAFNMTMPLTLWAAAKLLPGSKGFAFGMLTFALFLGFLPAWLGWGPLLQGGWGYALGALASLALLLSGLRKGALR